MTHLFTKRSTRVLSVFLTALMLFALIPAVPVSAGTYGDFTYTVTNGEVTITDYPTTATGAVVIPAKIGGYPVTSIGSYAFYECTGLTSVSIPNGVTSIGSSAFAECNSLASVTIPDSVTYIGSNAFYACLPLTSVSIPNGVTSIGDYTFADCTALTSITIPNTVTSIGSNAFDKCYRLSSITIPDSVTHIGRYAFEGTAWYDKQPNGVVYVGKAAYQSKGTMPANTHITLRDGTKSIVRCAFEDCTNLTNITIPDSVESIGHRAFEGTAWFNNQPDGLVYAGKVAYKYKGTMPASTQITLRDGTKSLTDYAFAYCAGLTSVAIPDSVTSIGEYAFYICTGLTGSVTIPDSVTSIGVCAFYRCTGLTSVTIPDSVTSIGVAAFDGCSNLKLYVPMNSYALDYAKTNSITYSYAPIVVTGNTVTLGWLGGLESVTYAKGTHASTAALLAAADALTLDADAIAANTADGVFSLELAENGVYTFAFAYSDGEMFIEDATIVNNKPSVTTDGLSVMLHNIYGVSDFFIAPGHWTTYREVANNKVLRVRSVNLGGRNDYTCKLPAPGEYTLWARYTDRAPECLYFTCEVTVPSIVVDGIRVTVSNLDGVRVIRTAPGEWTTPGQIKRAAGARNFTAATIAKRGGDPFVISYAENGKYTLSIEYTNGYAEVHVIDIAKRVPTVVYDGNNVTLSALDGLYVLRYAPGTYTTSSQVKAAPAAATFVRHASRTALCR